MTKFAFYVQTYDMFVIRIATYPEFAPKATYGIVLFGRAAFQAFQEMHTDVGFTRVTEYEELPPLVA